MISMSSRTLKSITLMTKPAPKVVSGAWAERQITINLIGLDEPAEDIGLALVRKGVSILRLYDPTQLVRHRNAHACAPAYRALALTHRLAREPGNPQTRIFGYPFRFDQVTAFPCDVAIVINPNRPMCAFCNAYFEATQTPYVQVTLSPDGAEGCVRVHRMQPCLSGLETGSCPPTSGKEQVISVNGATDVCTRVVSLVSEVMDSLVVGRELLWNSLNPQRSSDG